MNYLWLHLKQKLDAHPGVKSVRLLWLTNNAVVREVVEEFYRWEGVSVESVVIENDANRLYVWFDDGRVDWESIGYLEQEFYW